MKYFALYILSIAGWVAEELFNLGGAVNALSWGVALLVCGASLVHLRLNIALLKMTLVFLALVFLAILTSDYSGPIYDDGVAAFFKLMLQAMIIAPIFSYLLRAGDLTSNAKIFLICINILVALLTLQRGSVSGVYSLAAITTDWSFKIRWFDIQILLVACLTIAGSRNLLTSIYCWSCVLCAFAFTSKIGIIAFFVLAVVTMPQRYNKIAIFIGMVLLVLAGFYSKVIIDAFKSLAFILNFERLLVFVVSSAEGRSEFLLQGFKLSELSFFGDFGWQLALPDIDGHGARFGAYAHSVIGILYQFGVLAFLIYLILMKSLLRGLFGFGALSFSLVVIFLGTLVFVRPVFSAIALVFVFAPMFKAENNVSSRGAVRA